MCGGERGMNRDKWLTPKVLFVAEEQIVENEIILSKRDMWLSWSLLWLAFPFEGGQTTVMFELPEGLGVVGEDAHVQACSLQPHGL